MLSELSLLVGDELINADLFMTPVLRLSNSLCLVSPSYVLSGRYMRNVVKLLITRHGFNPQQSGPHLVEFVRKAFCGAQFQVSPARPLNVYAADGNLITDIDLAAFKDKHLFIAEVRTHLEPDSVAEKYNLDLR